MAQFYFVNDVISIDMDFAHFVLTAIWPVGEPNEKYQLRGVIVDLQCQAENRSGRG